MPTQKLHFSYQLLSSTLNFRKNHIMKLYVTIKVYLYQSKSCPNYVKLLLKAI